MEKLYIIDFDLDITNHTFTFSWNPIEGINEYQVYKNNQLVETTSITSFTDQEIGDHNYYISCKEIKSELFHCPIELLYPLSPTILDCSPDSKFQSVSLFIQLEQSVTLVEIYKDDQLLIELNEPLEVDKDGSQIYAYDDLEVTANQHYTYQITAYNQYGKSEEDTYITVLTYHMIPETIQPSIIQRKYEKSIYTHFNFDQNSLDYCIYYRLSNGEEYHYTLLNNNPYDHFHHIDMNDWIDCCIVCSNGWGKSDLVYKRYPLQNYEVGDVDNIQIIQERNNIQIRWDAVINASLYYITIYDDHTLEVLSEDITRSNHYYYNLPFESFIIQVRASNEWSISKGKYQSSIHTKQENLSRNKALILTNTSFPNGSKSAYDFKVLMNYHQIETKYYADLTKNQLTDLFKIYSMNTTKQDITYILLNGHGSYQGIYLCKNGREDIHMNYIELKKLMDMIQGEKIVIIDACFSGNFIDQIFNYSNHYIKQVIRSKNQYHILTSSTSQERTWIFDHSYSKSLYYICLGCGFDTRKELFIEPELIQPIQLKDLYNYVQNKMDIDNQHYLQTSNKIDDCYIQNICLYPENDPIEIM